MIPAAGTTCLFTFTTPFASLNGIYVIMRTMTFETALATGVNFVASLYTPAGLSAGQYTSDASSYANQTVLQIQSVAATKQILYIPIGVLSQVPDPTVKRYSDVYLSIHIGPFADETVYTWIAGQLNDIASSVTGNTDTAQFYSNPADDVYLTHGAYAALSETRAANIKTITPLSVQKESLFKYIETLQAKVAAYEKTIIALHTQNTVIQSILSDATSTLGSIGSTGIIS